MTPAPVVPPTSTPQPAAAAARPFSPRWWPRFFSTRRSGTVAIKLVPITSAAPRPVSSV